MDSRVRSGSWVTSRPPPPWGVYEATLRGRSSIFRPSSSISAWGNRLTRYEKRDSRASTPGKRRPLTAAPPSSSRRSRTSTERPARLSNVAATRPLWPPPTTTTSWWALGTGHGPGAQRGLDPLEGQLDLVQILGPQRPFQGGLGGHGHG